MVKVQLHPMRKWVPDQVLREISQCRDLSAKYNQQSHPSLYAAALRYFGSWKQAVEKAGFNYQTVTKRKPAGYWNKERVIEEIGKLSHKNSNYVRKHRADLYNAAIRIFESWQKAIEAAGFYYIDVRLGWASVDATQLRFRKKA